ncbi:hypothetical protein PGH07_04095 [Sulfurovum sp. zt1-1]|uniref:Uncharacterized protein n=1 Tax=Sulfurovum zhangzhouensis TaxID=3019067 RepID=A0ABT7QWZ5_9BACT|nr:hypothetical protein [Sulfurovum zhangzhouensis]MDM5271349.1 hypothetical protein [Sulfurovum zhangzhouensis]
MNDDERAMMMLEKSIYEAKEMLEEKHIFRPFAMILDQNGSIRRMDNDIEDMQVSYMQLHDEITAHVQMRQTADIIVLLTNASMPEQLVEDGIESSIRIHLEERSQLHKAIPSRYIYVPYQLQRLSGEEKIEAKLFHPQAVSFPAEFFRKEG